MVERVLVIMIAVVQLVTVVQHVKFVRIYLLLHICSIFRLYLDVFLRSETFGLCSSSDTFGVTPILLVTFGRGSSQYSKC